METTVDALKRLYVVVGGAAADVANLNLIPEVISAIADQIERNKNQ